jgi:hypothetical protein
MTCVAGIGCSYGQGSDGCTSYCSSAGCCCRISAQRACRASRESYCPGWRGWTCGLVYHAGSAFEVLTQQNHRGWCALDVCGCGVRDEWVDGYDEAAWSIVRVDAALWIGRLDRVRTSN